MTVIWTAEEAVRATGGRAIGEWHATGVSIDTRTLKPGDMFVALKAARDGHEFVGAALEQGAAAALVSQTPDGLEGDPRLLIVDDVLRALEALGREARARTNARVIAITGSAGKTSTKDMLRHVLTPQGATHAAEASYNNHWGVPLTLARMPQVTQFAIIEIGMNHPGEIAPLAKMARPHVAVVTTVAAAHLEAFECIEGIAQEKAAIFEGLERDGVAIFNGDVSTAPILASKAKTCSAEHVAFGAEKDSDVRLLDVTQTAGVTVVKAEKGNVPVLFKVGAPGIHFAMNALAVLEAVERVGADPVLAACDLALWAPPAGRGTRETLSIDDMEDWLTIDLIDDAFNANPASVAAALDVLAAAEPIDDRGKIARGRRIAILGDMLELGREAAQLHAEIAAYPAMQSVAVVHCAGPLMAELWSALPPEKRGVRTERAEDLVKVAHDLIDAGDVVLVKGSKGSRVSLVAEAIRALGQPRPDLV